MLRLPRPLDYQAAALAAPQRYQLLRWGRRCGKTVTGLVAALAGHGPGRGWRGALQGAPIVWLTPDYPQAREVWRTQVRRRLAGLPVATISETERRVDLATGGSLEIRSAEAVDGIRGRQLGGVVVDEAAWLDLEYAWQDVLRPALADLGGWALLISTPNAGHDGNGLKRTPSYFNVLCQRVAAGELDPGLWAQDHRRTRDNPTIPAAEIAQLYGEYPPDSPVSQQELDALLLQGGAGLAFPEFDRLVHVQRVEPERDDRWAWSAGLDWGYRTHGWCGLFGQGPDGDQVLRWEYPFRERPPYDVGYALGHQLRRFPRPEWIAADAAMWAVTDGGLTIAERVQAGLRDAIGDTAPALIAAPKGRAMDGGQSHRVAAILQMHQLLAYTRDPDGAIQPQRRPRFLVHPDCTYWLRTVPSLPVDPRRPEDLDTTAEDHAWDGTMYWLLCRPPIREVERNVPFSRDRHPGLDRRGRRKPYPGSRPPIETAAWDLEDAVRASEGRLWGYRYHGGQDLGGLVEVGEED